MTIMMWQAVSADTLYFMVISSKYTVSITRRTIQHLIFERAMAVSSITFLFISAASLVPPEMAFLNCTLS
jgi:hypothetical protein